MFVAGWCIKSTVRLEQKCLKYLKQCSLNSDNNKNHNIIFYKCGEILTKSYLQIKNVSMQINLT